MTHVRVSFLVMAESYSIVWMGGPQFVHLLMDILGCSHVLAATTNAAMNICVQLFIWTLVLSWLLFLSNPQAIPEPDHSLFSDYFIVWAHFLPWDCLFTCILTGHLQWKLSGARALVLVLLFFSFCFYWHIVAFQCCVYFCCTAKWISSMYMYAPLAWISSPFRSPQGTE